MTFGEELAMWPTFKFGMHWRRGAEMYYDELTAGSKEEAEDYFIDHKRDDVSLVELSWLDRMSQAPEKRDSWFCSLH